MPGCKAIVADKIFLSECCEGLELLASRFLLCKLLNRTLLALVGRPVFFHIMKTVNLHFSTTTIHIMEVAASVQLHVILDQSYYITQARCRNHVVVLEVISLTAAVTIIMNEC